jgi:4,5-dihydroxyphthalate decarboxylase
MALSSRPPMLIQKGHPHIGWLFLDPTALAKDYLEHTGFFPIVHPSRARRRTSATKVTVPFVEKRLKERVT